MEGEGEIAWHINRTAWMLDVKQLDCMDADTKNYDYVDDDTKHYDSMGSDTKNYDCMDY